MTALLPAHLADLARSGLTERDATAAGMRSLSAEEVSAIVGFPVRSGGYAIPYPGTDGVRFRLVPPHVFADGKSAKYLSPTGAASRLYIPPGVLDELDADPTRVLYLVEGEKKALAMRKALGVRVIGLPGVDGWSTKKRTSGVVQDLDELRRLLIGRRVVIAFDSDARTNANVAGAAFRLASWLRDDAEAVASWAFPESDGDAKVGMDDLIVAKGADAARAILDATREPMEPGTFVFRELVRRTAATNRSDEFVGTALFDELRRVLVLAPASMRPALAEEARKALKLTAQERSALVADLGQPGKAKEEAQGKTLAFEDTEPWDAPVDLGDVLDEILATVRRYLVLPTGADVAITLWIAFTWVFECYYHAPRLVARSPVKRCGKTTLLQLLRSLSRRALMASNVTGSVVFRAIEAFRPTLLVDEWDSFAEGREELRNVLNSGHSKDGVVLRSEGESFEPRAFSTWSPAAIAAIGRIPDTLADRAVEIPMRRKRRGERTERVRGDRVFEDLAPLRRKLLRWANDARESLSNSDPEVPEQLDDRGADNWRPLLSIADAAGGEWPARARKSALGLSAARDADADESVGVRLLLDIRTALGDDDRIPSADLVRRLVAMEDRPWAEYSKGEKPLTAPALAKLLKAFEIRPRSVRLPSGDTPKGYLREQFAEAWDRYLRPGGPDGQEPSGGGAEATPPSYGSGPGVGAATPPQSSNYNGSSPIGDPPQDERVADRESPADVGSSSLVAVLRPEGADGAADAELFEERAAIGEFDGGQSRDDAERVAREEVARRRTLRGPGWVAPGNSWTPPRPTTSAQGTLGAEWVAPAPVNEEEIARRGRRRRRAGGTP